MHFQVDTLRGVFDNCDAEVPRGLHILEEKSQPRVDETLRWKVAPDLPDPADLPDLPDQVSSAAGSNHSNTRAGGEDYVSSNQTPSNYG